MPEPFRYAQTADVPVPVLVAQCAAGWERIGFMDQFEMALWKIVPATVHACGSARGVGFDRLATIAVIRLNATTPFIQLRAETTKAGRADVLPLHQDTAQSLWEARGEAGDDEQVFGAFPGSKSMYDGWRRLASRM